MTPDRLALLRNVEFLAPLDDETLAELAWRARVARYAPGEAIVGELEPGADVFLLVAGCAEVVVEPHGGDRRVLHTLSPGSAFGEMASLTGELRSATVIATDDVELLVIRDADFDRLRERRPEVAVALLGTLGKRLVDTDRAIEALLADPTTAAATDAPAATAPGSIRRVWRELVVNHHRDLAFLTLAAFVVTLVVVRLTIYLSFRLDITPRGVLRTAYITGFALLVLSAASALLAFRPLVRKLVAIAYGVGAALIFNELGVTLAFDIFFKDIHTPDPDVAFDVERLYHRTEPVRAIAIGLVVLIQAVYLRPFYRRAWFIAGTRTRRLFARKA
ncbi:MAG TPA: cyclic nucleotide-binding domain-containing protein [Kofleriaceae bacterium]|nr:cyclic nucleotide-binding domain-containing protein [Kofleriaceae bacterium]